MSDHYGLREEPPNMCVIDTVTVEGLSALRTSLVADYLKKELRLTNFVPRGPRLLFPLADPGRTIVGHAVTVQYAPVQEPDLRYVADNRDKGIRYIRELGESGAIVVVATQGAPYSFWGGNVSLQAAETGCVGVVVDGTVRDVRDIRQSGLACFATGTSPLSRVGYYQKVATNVPITCGGARVRYGDIILGDDDGVVVVPAEFLARLLDDIPLIERVESESRLLVRPRE